MNMRELLRLRDVADTERTKFIRHQGDLGIVEKLRRQGLLREYERLQQGRNFQNCKYIVSFLGLPNRHARLFGVYRVAGMSPSGELPRQLVKEGVPPPRDGDVVLQLEDIPSFDDLKGRVVVAWNNPRTWHQWANGGEWEVVEILPRGYVRPFPGYLDFVLYYDELRELVEHPAANREWKTMLGGVAGVYLIVDNGTGDQYVGSASGRDGIWARWREYAKTGHGGNKLLRAKLDGDPSRVRHLRFAILRTLPKTLTHREVVRIEALYKKKLGSRAFGLNAN